MFKPLRFLPLAGSLLFGLSAAGQCPAGQSQVQISILTDNYGDETTWTLTGPGGAPVYGSGGPYANNQTYTPTVCVPNGPVIVFTIFDSFGDGICCQYGNGNYTVTVNGTQVGSGGNFTTQDQAVFITSTAVANDLACMSINLAGVVAQGNQTIAGTVRNFGTAAVNNFTLNYSIDNGPAVSQPVTASIAPGATYNFSHGTPWNATVGAHTVKVWATNLNGGADGNTLNDELEVSVNVATQSVQRKALMEQFTSSTCPPCASLETSWGNPVLAAQNPNQSGSNLAAIKYHLNFPSPGNDPSFNPDASTRRSYYGVNGIPSRFMDGISFNSTAATFLTNAQARQAFLNVETSYSVSGSTITVNVTVTPYANFTGTHRLFMAVVEDSYNYAASTTNQDVFKYVMRKMLPNGNGILLSNLTAGVPQTFTESYTFQSGAPAQGNYNLWTNLDNTTVLAFVQNTTTRDVLNAAFTPVGAVGVEENSLVRGINIHPNPSNGTFFVEYELPAGLTAELEVVDLLGARVAQVSASTGNGFNRETIDLSGLSDGIYMVNIVAGGERVSRRVVITR